jgi:phosphohistidine phosphatase
VKTILLMRHAKSDWGDPGLDDFDRPLAKRGIEDAPRMGRAVARLGVVPDHVVSSPARRARETAERFAEAAGFRGTIHDDANLYPGPGEAWIRALRGLSDDVSIALVVAHSPGCEEAAALLLGAGSSNAVRFPTGAILCAEADVERWSRLKPGNVTLRWFLAPRLVKAL